MLDGLKAVLRLYGARGFVVRIFNADNEFECLREDLLELGVVLNVASANEHCPFIERRIRWIKEKARSVRHDLPYAVMPKLMIVELLYFVVHWLNAFPAKNGVSDTISPGTILTGVTPDYKKHCKANFGSYVQTHEEFAPRNSMEARTIGAITLGSDNSEQAGYWFMSLNTGKRIHRRNWTPLPMSDEVVSRVEQLGRRDGQPNLLVFANKHGENLLDEDLEIVDDDDLSYATEVGADEIPGADSDLSEEGDDEEDPLESSSEVQQPVGELQGNAELETIQEEATDEEATDEETENEEVEIPRNLSPRRPASRVSNLESVSQSPLAKSTPEQVKKARKNLEDTATEFFMPEESPSRYPSRKREAVKRLAMQHGGKSYDEHTLAQMICMSMIVDKHAPKRLSLNSCLRVWGER